MKLLRPLQTYLLVALPFVVGVSIWSESVPEGKFPADTPLTVRVLWELLSWNLMIWFTLLILFLLALVLSSAARDTTLRRLANIRDRDEREEFLTGQAARTSYVSTLAFGILLLFLSAFRFGYTEHSVSINMKPSLCSGFVLGLLLWQLGSFRFAMRKLTREE